MEPIVAIVGATGAVGELMCRVVLERQLPFREIRFLASERSAGRQILFNGQQHTVKVLSPESFQGVDIVLSSTPASVSKQWSPVAALAGATVVDNSSAWRMDSNVPLIVPEVNAEAMKSIPKGIVANPNCSTIQMVVALKPLHDIASIKRIVVSTYQASSGKGATGLADLDAQVRALGNGKPLPPATAHVDQLAGNVLAHDWKLGEDDYSEEEWKMIRETRKIMGDESIQISATAVRVPVRTGHSESINVEFHKPLELEIARKALSESPGIVLVDKPGIQHAPTPAQCEGKDEVFVGRLRKDPSVPFGINMWVVADNLRKGAATNAVQIADILIKSGNLKRR